MGIAYQKAFWKVNMTNLDFKSLEPYTGSLFLITTDLKIAHGNIMLLLCWFLVIAPQMKR